MKSMKVAVYTLGCKVNQYETQAMEQALRNRGHVILNFHDLSKSEAADVYIINSCSVTAVSDQKSRQILHRVRREHPDAVLALCGCYPQTHPDKMADLDVDLIAGTGDRTGFLDLLEQAFEHKKNYQKNNRDQDDKPIQAIDRAFDRREFEILSAGGLENRTRAMLKIEDGCVNFCAYCIIPYARGPVRSLSLERAVLETRRLEQDGYRELVLTGIEISSWGMDFKNDMSLIDLIEAICKAASDMRIRLGSLEPRTITEDFCRRAAALPNLCPHFHLSLQSGCDATLKRMNRKYNTARYLESVLLLNQSFSRPALTTDLITGFPEESDAEFAQTLDFIKQCGFAQMHIFPYSIRPGTPAADMRQVPKSIKNQRAKQATVIAAELRRSYLNGCIGQIYPVLFEQPKQNRFGGHAPNYMPVLLLDELDKDNKNSENLQNQIRDVRISSTDGEVLFGTIE